MPHPPAHGPPSPPHAPPSPPHAPPEDKKRRELVDTKNQADSVVYQTEKQLEEFKDKVPAEIKAKVGAGVVRHRKKGRGLLFFGGVH